MSNTILYKVLIIVLLVWSVVSTTYLAYYYNEYLNVVRGQEALVSKLGEFEATLDALKSQLSNLSSKVAFYNESYVELLAKMRLFLQRSVAILVIDYGNGTIERHKVYFIEGFNNTVFNITFAVASINYTYYPSLDDYFINGINGVENMMVNSTSGYYWMFYVNFRLSDKGAYQTRVFDGDIIIWNYTFVSWGS